MSSDEKKKSPFADMFAGFGSFPAFERFPDLSLESFFTGPVAGGAPMAAPAPRASSAPAPQAAPAADGQAASSAPEDASNAPRGGDIGPRALEVAKGEVDVREIPKGSNRGPRVDIYQDAKGEYWCCHFVSWCVEQTGPSPFGHKSWVEGLRRWAKSNGKYIPAREAQARPGDIFTMARYDKEGNLAGGHTGFIESVSDDGQSFRTIEGNSSDKVRRRGRRISELDGFVRV